VEDIILSFIPEYDTSTVIPINLSLFVVIDEAGSPRYKPFFGFEREILKLVTALENMSKYSFKKGVHVTLTGTGLEILTKSIDSTVSTIKFHMKPWMSTQFHALLANMKREDDVMVKGIVERFPILKNLTTNARCAYYLVNTMPNLTHVLEQRWTDYVAASVSDAAQCYIETNGLKNLRGSEKGKFTVAQEAFKILNDAMDHPSTPIFPKFNIQNARLLSLTLCLLDINVEEKTAGAEFTSENILYSVSMSPAISIVLAELLCENPVICWDWQGMEATAALGEWKRMITNMDVSEFTSACGVIRMWSPVPAGGAKVRFTLPVVNRKIVILNGPAAVYADVMAPFRLVKAIFSSKDFVTLKVDFETEMDEMGLTSNPTYRLQQAVTSALYVMWSMLYSTVNAIDDRGGLFADLDGFEEAQERTNVPTSKKEAKEGARCEHYPYQALLSNCTTSHETASFIIEDGNRNVLVDDGDVGATKVLKRRQIKVWEEFTSQNAVTAVFVTNAESLVLEKKEPEVEPAAQDEQPAGGGSEPAKKRAKGGGQQQNQKRKRPPAKTNKSVEEKYPPFSIQRKDVDWRGILKMDKQLPDYLVCNLRKNVEVRFLFY
jgi:hypothetical protein